VTVNILSAFFAGLVFGLGLLIAGMTNPAKVVAFLDLAGDWDPSLAVVMISAIAVGVVAFALAKRRRTSLLGLPMQLPTSHEIDPRLIGGSLLFGIGWGLAGVCPGPALVLLGASVVKGWIFFASMLAGMMLVDWLERTTIAPHKTTPRPVVARVNRPLKN
jgi:uncharacterized protein